MKMQAEIYLALNLHKAPLIRQLAATVVTRYVMEFHEYGVFPEKETYQHFLKMCRRFRLLDYNCALTAHYPPKYL